MRTIKEAINTSGNGLMSGLNCNVNLFPRKEKGINFYLTAAKTPIAANYKSVVSTDNCVVLANNENARIILVEHFMAACAFAGIDSLDVHIDSPELPIFDGSALEWYKMLVDAGLDADKDIEQVSFEKPLGMTDGKTDIALIPAENFRITYCINFEHRDLSNRWHSFELSHDKEQIIGARTFGYLKDMEKFQQAGLALGVTIENTVGLTEDGYTVPLKSEREPVKHKILDLIGDLHLTGLNPLGFKAHIIAKGAGHKSHVEFAKLIANKLKSSAIAVS